MFLVSPVACQVCSRFPPVLHHFFLEAFRSPGDWFTRRTSFTRSVAVNSMAGYVIGLGDRHSGNILLDRTSAEVVHIDFGVAFEQGRFLNTPELVPFRLTRDIVDGCGAAGIEGALRRCCEETMRVLRENASCILTIVGVVIADPLYRWAMTPIKAQRRQQDIDDTGDEHGDADVDDGGDTIGNADAERAVLRVKQKLAGVEVSGAPRNVPGQVAMLLADAQDPDKLCRMFPGWAPWM